MPYLIKDELLELKYVPGKGAWTYHIQIPNSKHIKGRWGFLKVSGTIDGYKLESKNLFTITGQDKLLAVNSTIRKSIKKSGGDMVLVTLQLIDNKEKISPKKILDSFKEAGVLKAFEKLEKEGKAKILDEIMCQKTDESQVKAIIKQIDKLGRETIDY